MRDLFVNRPAFDDWASSYAARRQRQDSVAGSPPPLAPLASGGGGTLRALWRAIFPVDATEGRALAVLALARFVLVPVSCLLAFRWALARGLLGALATDVIFLFVLAVQAVMPSAQNLIIMLQLSDATRPAAPPFARMLLKLYAYAVLPVTLWVTAAATHLAIPLA